jgi:hypothetical protein
MRHKTAVLKKNKAAVLKIVCRYRVPSIKMGIDEGLFIN